MRNWTLYVGGAWLLTSMELPLASGFAIPETSILGLGTSNAVVANPNEVGAFAYNPAAMGFHQHSSVSGGAIAILPDLSVRTNTGSHDSDGSNSVFVPMLQGALKVHENWTLGLWVGAPFGLETKWKQNVFVGQTPATPSPPFANGKALAGTLPTHSKLELISAMPTLTFRVNDNLSLAAGADYYNSDTVRLNSLGSKLEGDGDGWGWNLSGLFRTGSWSFGANYHSKATVDVTGHIDDLTALGLPSQKAKADLNLPWRLQVGARYQATARLAVELDFSRTGWSEFDQLKIKPRGAAAFVVPNPLPFLPPPAGGATTTTSTIVSSNDWDDSNAYRLGLTYDLPGNNQLRLGYTFDETPQDDRHFSARIPDNDRHLFSVGFGHETDSGWLIEGGYMYVSFNDRKVRNTATQFDPSTGAVDTDPNGTSSVNGKYESSVHLFGVGLTKIF